MCRGARGTRHARFRTGRSPEIKDESKGRGPIPFGRGDKGREHQIPSRPIPGIKDPTKHRVPIPTLPEDEERRAPDQRSFNAPETDGLRVNAPSQGVPSSHERTVGFFTGREIEGNKAPASPTGRASGGGSPYLHLTGLHSPASTLSQAVDRVTKTQAAQRRALEQVLIRTQGPPPPNVVTTFVYDGEGNRVVKNVDGWVTVYIGQHYVCQGTEDALNTGTSLSCVKMIFANGQRVAMVDVGPNPTVTYFHQDHLGSSSVTTDQAGVVDQEYTYYPYGATNFQSGLPEDDVHYKFTGQELDGSTGLYDYHARLYDPVIGRFISPDNIVPELFNPQALNRYSYVGNNPLRYIDPTGNQKVALNDFDLDQTTAFGLNSLPTNTGNPMGTPGPLLAMHDTSGSGGKVGETNVGKTDLPGDVIEPAPFQVDDLSLKGIGKFLFGVIRGIKSIFAKQGAKQVDELKAVDVLAVDATNAKRLEAQLAGQEIAGGHAFSKHAQEFGFRTQTEMARHVENVINNPTAVRQLSNGRTVYWHDPTQSVVIRNPQSIDGGTVFKPTAGRSYFDNLR